MPIATSRLFCSAIRNLALGLLSQLLLVIATPGLVSAAERERGDLNNDGNIDLSDLVQYFGFLTRGEYSGFCRIVADVNGDERLDYSDAIYLSLFLFSDGPDLVPLPSLMTPCGDPMTGMTLRRLEAVSLTPASAMVSWESPIRASTQIRYGTTAETLDKTVDVTERVFYHQVLLRDLQPFSTYFYQAESETEDGLKAVSEVKSFRTHDTPKSTVRRDRPRLLLTQKDLVEIRRSISPRAAKHWLWAELTEWCDARLDLPIKNLAEDDDVDQNGRAFAFAALLSDNPSYRLRAIQLATHIADNGVGGELRGSIEAMAYVYDWLHDSLPEQVKEQIRSRLLRSCYDLESQNRDDEFVTGHSHGNHKSLILGLLAVEGESPKADQLLEQVVQNYRYGFLATWRRFGGTDGGSSKGWWYTTYALPFELEFFAAWRSATGEDLFQTERTWCEGLLDWFVHGMRGDHTFLREGDNRVFNGLNFQDRHFGQLLAREYGNSLGQWFAQEVLEETPVWGPHVVLDILWSDPDVEVSAPSGPTVRHFRNAGVVIMKESWKRDATLAAFRSAEAYTLGHTHRDNCSFTLFFKGGLALDTGIYDEYGSEHYRNYYSRSVAHNTITVYDPSEEFKLYGGTYANDGGQRWLAEGTDVENAWPARAEDTIDRAAGYRLGGITRHEDAEDYSYTVGSGGAAYSRKKLKRFLRHFLWLKRVNGWERPVMLVFDDVISTKPSFKKTYLLHTEMQPLIKGPLVTVLSGTGKGKMFHFTLAPDAAVLTPVGGPGMQYWVDGKNYPPSRSPRENEESGSWRLEVSPSVESREDRFLHALYPAETEDAAPASAVTFVVGPMQLCELAQWTILFDFGSLPDVYEYPNRRPETSHLIFGALPNTHYAIFVNNTQVATALATFAGALRFDVQAVGSVRIERVKSTP